MKYNEKAYLVDGDNYYLDFNQFANSGEFANFMYQFLDEFAKEMASSLDNKYEILRLWMHNDHFDIKTTYLYPYIDKSIGFDLIYDESIENGLLFLMVNIIYIDQSIERNGSLIKAIELINEN